MNSPGTNKPKRQIAPWLLGAGLLIVAIGGWLTYRIASGDLSVRKDPRFVITSMRPVRAGANASFIQHLAAWCETMQRSLFTRSRVTYTFSPHPIQPSSIQGLLGQCTECTGVKYYIARDVASGFVNFGYTNALSGAQWSQAFSDALQTGYPEWFDKKTGKIRRENVVLVTNSPSKVYVLPAEMVAEFRDK